MLNVWHIHGGKKPNQLSALYINVPKGMSVVLILQIGTFKKKSCYCYNFTAKEIIFTLVTLSHLFNRDHYNILQSRYGN